MLSFTSSLRDNSEAFAIFITEKYDYKDKKGVLPDGTVKKIPCMVEDYVFTDIDEASQKDTFAASNSEFKNSVF